MALLPLARKCRSWGFSQFRGGFPANCDRAPIVYLRLRQTPRAAGFAPSNPPSANRPPPRHPFPLLTAFAAKDLTDQAASAAR